VPSSASSVFVSHEYAAHPNQTIASTSIPRASPRHVGSAASMVVTCVIANTNTRSKKSSSGVTRCSDSTW
jgi:hypothetical protein